MATSNVPLPTIDDTGVTAPTSEALYTGVMADFAAAFGTAAMSTDPETPQGQLATISTTWSPAGATATRPRFSPEALNPKAQAVPPRTRSA